VKRYAQVLQRLFNAMAFANAGNFREFEELLEERDRRLALAKRSTARHCGAATRRTRRQAPTALGFPLNEAVPR
jgi:hypothetical protein